MLRNSKASVVYFGCSRFGWGYRDFSPADTPTNPWGPSLAYMREFLKCIFQNRTLELGQSFFDHKATLISSCGNNNAHRWIQFGFNFQGDPALQVIGVLKAYGDSPSTNEDTLVNINVLSNDVDTDGDTLSVNSITQGSNGTVANNGTDVDYTPNADWNGTDTFTYTATDGNGDFHTATVTVTVNPVNDTPVANNDSKTTNEDTGATINVLANDTDIDTDPLSVSAVTNGTHGIVTNFTFNVSYMPDPDWNGVDTFTYTMSDGNGGTDTATVTVTVNAVPDTPDAVDDTVSTNKNIPVTVSVLANDTDADGDTLSITSVTVPVNGGTANINGTDVDYSPPPNWIGTDTFTYDISDGNGGTDTSTVTVTVKKPKSKSSSSKGCGCSPEGLSMDRDPSGRNFYLLFTAFFLAVCAYRFLYRKQGSEVR
jgi:hypothetical protein